MDKNQRPSEEWYSGPRGMKDEGWYTILNPYLTETNGTLESLAAGPGRYFYYTTGVRNIKFK